MADPILLTVSGNTTAIDAAKKQIAQFREEIAKLQENFKRSGGDANDFLLEVGRIEEKIARTQQTIKLLGSSSGVGGAVNAVKNNFQALTYTLDDLQYVGEMGLRPIINNLMMISPVVGLAAMAADQLIRHWDQVSESFAGTSSKAKEVKDALQQLADAKAINPEQVAGAAEMGRIEAGMKAVFTEPTPAEKKQEETVKEILKGVDKQAVVRDMMGAQGVEFDESERKMMAEADLQEKLSSKGGYGGRLMAWMVNAWMRGRFFTSPADQAAELRKEATKKANNRVASENAALLAAAERDPAALRDLISKLRGSGNSGLADRLENARKEKGEKEMERAIAEQEADVAMGNEQADKEEEARRKKKQRQNTEVLDAIAQQEADVAAGNEKADKEEKQYAEQKRQYALNMIESRLGLGMAQKAMFANIFKAPERIGAADFARQAESGGAKDQLELMHEQINILKAIETATKLAANPPKLGK